MWEDGFGNVRRASGPQLGIACHPYRDPPGGLYSTGRPTEPSRDRLFLVVLRSFRHGIDDAFGELRSPIGVRHAL